MKEEYNLRHGFFSGPARLAVGRQEAGQADGPGELEGGAGDAVDVEADLGELFVALGVEDEAVGQAEPADVRREQAGVVGRFEHRRAEPAGQAALLDRQDEAALLDRLEDRRPCRAA